jgi:hypothetical protein
MIVVGVIVWMVAVAWPGTHLAMLMLAGTLVGWGTFALLHETNQ